MSVVPKRETMSSKAQEMLEQRSCGVAVELRLISVDDVNELFKTAVLVHCVYEDDSVPSDPSAVDDFERDPDYDGFIPEIKFVNVVYQQYEQDEVVVRVNRRTGRVWSTLRNSYDINEALELQQFPVSSPNSH